MRGSLMSVLVALVLCVSGAANAQVRVNVHVNIGSQPVWGPVGYDYVDYYYLPDIEVYYSVPLHRYYYNRGGRWLSATTLPPQYRKFDLYHAYKVVINDRDPWKHHEMYREKYQPYKDRHDQQVIRDSRDSRYYVIKGHPEHDNWVRQQKRDNGRHEGQNKDDRGNEKSREHDNGNHRN